MDESLDKTILQAKAIKAEELLRDSIKEMAACFCLNCDRDFRLHLLDAYESFFIDAVKTLRDHDANLIKIWAGYKKDNTSQ